jgi:16S rRNA (cytosine1402-N4)-methyltransferase
MLSEIISGFNIIPDGIYLDGTFGRGGHSQALLQKLNANGRLLCFDKDPSAISHGKACLGEDKRVEFFHACFSEIAEVVEQLGLKNKINGILLDLGVSSPQLDEPLRGFSFMREGPLDMRMDNSQGMTAKDWINSADETEITRVLKIYGEERFAKKIARNIVKMRLQAPLETTQDLAKLVSHSKPRPLNGRHPATQTFQAIRIFINQELEVLEETLQSLSNVLAFKGRLAVLTFHSLEDRLVKHFISDQAAVKVPRRLPIQAKEITPPYQWVIKRQSPSNEEIEQNMRARSATLRIAERNL